MRLVESAESPPAGLVAGKYRLTRLLGRGGMGSVWEGSHTSLGTLVAVKFIEAEHATSDEARARFVNEAHAAARLNSKHVVQVFDHGVGEDGCPYIVMEFLSGEPLDARLDRQGVISPAEMVEIVNQVARGLQKAHELGIVHRDLKPENVFLVWDEEDQRDLVKVVDFGIAKFLEGASPTGSSTRTGAVLGTPFYMSPEQARGLSAIDHRSDLWSLGVVVYRSLVGDLPFSGEAVGDLLVKICTVDPVVPSQVRPSLPPGFDGWVAKALAREPDQRFQSARELALALAAALEVSSASVARGAALSLSDANGSAVNAGSAHAPSGDAGSAATRLAVPAHTVATFSNTAGEAAPAGAKRRGRVVLIAAVAALSLAAVGVLAATTRVQADPAAELAAPPAPGGDAALVQGSSAAQAASSAPTVQPIEVPASPAESAQPAPVAARGKSPGTDPSRAATKPPAKPSAAATAAPAPSLAAVATPTAAPTPTPKPAPTPKLAPTPRPTSTGRDLGY